MYDNGAHMHISSSSRVHTVDIDPHDSSVDSGITWTVAYSEF